MTKEEGYADQAEVQEAVIAIVRMVSRDSRDSQASARVMTAEKIVAGNAPDEKDAVHRATTKKVSEAERIAKETLLQNLGDQMMTRLK